MKKTMGMLIAAMMSFSANSADSADYIIDTKGTHASINFKISHLGYSFIKGRFNDFSGQFSYDPTNISASNVEVIVNTQSLDSNHEERDKHVRSDDFIDASKYPQAKFVSTKVVDKGMVISKFLEI